MKIEAVIGIGYGDEGKGKVTSYLATQDPLATTVVRFNGGHQAGHTVVHDGKRHVFSSFGSGTLCGAKTYWSRFCTVYPTALMNEFNVLPKGIALVTSPMLYVDPLCPVTTPFDVIANHAMERRNGHGSVGVGFGTTLARHDARYRLHFMDIFHPTVFNQKYKAISEYWTGTTDSTTLCSELPEREARFMEAIEWIRNAQPFVICGKPVLRLDENIIFEGAQGILLDQDHGFFPNVTRSNTTCKNMWDIIPDLKIDKNKLHGIRINYVTRSYLTRHGNGFMPNEDIPPKLVNNDSETNVESKWQGKFRTGILDLDLLRYAVEVDRQYYRDLVSTNMWVTCVDQTGPAFQVTTDQNRTIKEGVTVISNLMPTYFSEGPESTNVRRFHG